MMSPTCRHVRVTNKKMEITFHHLVVRVEPTHSIGHNKVSNSNHSHYSDGQGTPPHGMALIHVQTALGRWREYSLDRCMHACGMSNLHQHHTGTRQSTKYQFARMSRSSGHREPRDGAVGKDHRIRHQAGKLSW